MENQEQTEEQKGNVTVTYLMIGLFALAVLLVKSDALNSFFYWAHCTLAN